MPQDKSPQYESTSPGDEQGAVECVRDGRGEKVSVADGLRMALLLLVAGKDASQEGPIPIPFVHLRDRPNVHPLAVHPVVRYRRKVTPPDDIFPCGTSTEVFAGCYWDIDTALSKILALPARVDPPDGL